MMRIPTVVLFFITTLGFSQGTLVVDSSSISFQIKNAGIVVNGTFKGLEAQIDFNPKKLKNSSIVASVDASSVDTGIRIRNNHLQREDYFDVKTYPRITMTSGSFKRNGGQEYLGDFIINLKGKEEHVQLPFSVQQAGSSYIFAGTFQLDREDFGIGDESIILSDNVQVTIWLKVSGEK